MPVLRTGTFTDKNNKQVTITAADLDKIVTGYKPDSPANFVIEHPKFDEIGFGYPSRLKRVGEFLLALPESVDNKFRSVVNSGKLPGRSVTLTKDFKLKNISFLPPEIKPAVSGLGDYTFSSAENEDVTLNIKLEAKQSVFAEVENDRIEFASMKVSEWWPKLIGRAIRQIKNYVTEKEGTEKADSLISEFDIEEITSGPSIYEVQSANEVKSEFSNNTNEEEMDIKELENKIVTLESENSQLKIELQSAKSSITTAEKEAKRKEYFQFCQSPEMMKRVKPADRKGIVETLLMLDEKGVIELSESVNGKEEKIQLNPADTFKNILKQLPEFDFTEFAKGKVEDDLSEEIKTAAEIAKFANR